MQQEGIVVEGGPKVLGCITPDQELASLHLDCLRLQHLFIAGNRTFRLSIFPNSHIMVPKIRYRQYVDVTLTTCSSYAF